MSVKTNKSIIRRKMKFPASAKSPTHCFSYDSEVLDEAKLGTETEAEKQIKLMLEKQLNTKVTLKECLEQKQEFVNSSTFTPLTELIQGACSLVKYQEIESQEEKHQELQRCGLSDDEIALYLSRSVDESGTSRKRACSMEPSVASKKLKEIEEKIAVHQKQLQAPSLFSGVKVLGRHAMDIEKTLYVGCSQKEQLKNLVMEHHTSNLSKSDPYNHIKELSLKLIQGKGKNNRVADEIETHDDSNSEFVYDPSIHHAIVPLEEQEIRSNQLSLEEIKKNPKFKDYEPGIPNKVLYLKNLHQKVTIRELQAVFDRFVKDGDGYISYRILSGRMKGQAFVTFPDVRTAVNALQFANGYMLKGRPVIIQYGKKS